MDDLFSFSGSVSPVSGQESVWGPLPPSSHGAFSGDESEISFLRPMITLRIYLDASLMLLPRLLFSLEKGKQ